MNPRLNVTSKRLTIGKERVLRNFDEKGRLLASPDLYIDEIYSEFCDKHLSDGLPIIPPVEERVERMLEYTDRATTEEITRLSPKNAPLTVEKLAINAVMAGCKPEYFPVLVTVFECMREDEYNLRGAAVTTHEAAHMVLVSGPIAEEVGIHGGLGCLGPGFRANATIGRAVNLALINIGGAIPGVLTRSTFQTPSRYSLCFAENRAEYPPNWKPLHEELYDKQTTTVTCMVGEGPQTANRGACNTPESVLTTYASAATSLAAVNATFAPNNLIVINNPENAKIISDAGWSKDDVKLFLYDNARNPRELVEKIGGEVGNAFRSLRCPWFSHALDGKTPCVTRPDDIIVAVAGGPGVFSAIIRPWLSRAITKPIKLGNGTHAKSVKEFEM